MNNIKEKYVARAFTDPIFKASYNYMYFVDILLQIINASTTADWQLHLSTGNMLAPIFFAMDRTKYKRLWPRYLADMEALENDEEIWEEFLNGNFAVSQ